jgi:hypothetical protein
MFLATLNDAIAGIQKKEKKQKMSKSFKLRSVSEKIAIGMIIQNKM